MSKTIEEQVGEFDAMFMDEVITIRDGEIIRRKKLWADREGEPDEAYQWLTQALQERDRIAREEAIKECEGCVPEEMEVTEPVANQSYSYNFYNRGHNSCREQTLQAIRQIYD